MEIKRPVSRQPLPSHATRVFRGVLFDVYQWEQKLFDGSTTTFEKLKRSDTIVVFPILPDGRILLIEDEQPGRDMIITAPAGRVEEGETAADAARRELLEETGYEVDLVLWKAFQPITKIDWAIYLFIGKNARKVAEPHLDPGEKIKERIVTFDELMELSNEPHFQNEEAALEVLEAKFNPEKMEELKKLFSN